MSAPPSSTTTPQRAMSRATTDMSDAPGKRERESSVSNVVSQSKGVSVVPYPGVGKSDTRPPATSALDAFQYLALVGAPGPPEVRHGRGADRNKSSVLALETSKLVNKSSVKVKLPYSPRFSNQYANHVKRQRLITRQSSQTSPILWTNFLPDFPNNRQF